MGFAPSWDLIVGGRDVLTEGYRRLVRRIDVQATVDGADQLAIEVTARADGRYRFVGETLLSPGTQVVVRAGYVETGLQALQRFTMTREETSYAAGAEVTATLIGYSAEHRLVDYDEARTWDGPIADSEIVRQLATEHGLAVTATSIETTAIRSGGRAKPQGTTDWDFLRQLAGANDYGEVLVRYDTDTDTDVLYWRTADLHHQAELATFVYDASASPASGAISTIHAFSPELSLAGVPSKVEVVGWDADRGEPVRVVIELGKLGQESIVYDGDPKLLTEAIRSGSELLVRVLEDTGRKSPKGKTERREVVTARHVATHESALAYARRWIATRNRAFMVARATVVGWEGLWAGQFHRFEGLAPHHVGLWQLGTCTHRIAGSGPYVCELDLSYVLEGVKTTQETT